MIGKLGIRLQRRSHLHADADIPALAQPADVGKTDADDEVLLVEIVEPRRQRIDVLVVGALDEVVGIDPADDQVGALADSRQRDVGPEAEAVLEAVALVPAETGTDVAATHAAGAVHVAATEQAIEPPGRVIDDLVDALLRHVEHGIVVQHRGGRDAVDRRRRHFGQRAVRGRRRRGFDQGLFGSARVGDGRGRGLLACVVDPLAAASGQEQAR